MMKFPRRSGVLLHITSLPSPYGIGDLGDNAYRFVDFLYSSGQNLWQILPLFPTGYNNSPYSSPSAFAGNSLLISPGELIKDGLISEKDLYQFNGLPSNRVDFPEVIKMKCGLLNCARNNFLSDVTREQEQAFVNFCKESSDWIEEYSLFQALKNFFNGLPWYNWPEPVAFRHPETIREYRNRFFEEIMVIKFRQFLFFQQWRKLKSYANQRGIKIIGDIPIFVNLDSADVWAHRRFFLLDEKGHRTGLSGVPPSRAGVSQIWDMPLYNWQAMEDDDYNWWKLRFALILNEVDIIRVDHFSGFYAFWHVNVGAKSSAEGRWVPGPGADFFRKIEKELGPLPIVGESLEPGVKRGADALLDELGYPGIRVLQHGFQGGASNPHLPKNYPLKCVAYSGTHDDNTILGWYRSLKSGRRRYVRRTLGINGGRTVNWQIIRVMEDTPADTTIIPLQDIIGLGSEARMNTPGIGNGQWEWRFNWNMLAESSAERLLNITRAGGR